MLIGTVTGYEDDNQQEPPVYSINCHRWREILDAIDDAVFFYNAKTVVIKLAKKETELVPA